MSRKTVFSSLAMVLMISVFLSVLPVQAGVSLPGTQTPLVTATPGSELLFLPLIVSDQQISPRIITIWYQYTGTNNDIFFKLYQEYDAAHPEITILTERHESLAEDVEVAVITGSGPDMVYYANDIIGELAYPELIVPLDEWFPRTQMAATFEPAAVQGMVWNDQLWAMPESQEGIALVYNTALISADEMPDSGDFAGFLSIAEDFQTANPGVKFICNQGLGGNDAYHAAPIYFGFGLNAYGGYVDENGTAYMDTPEALAAAEWIHDLGEISIQTTDYSICQNALLNGEVAAWWTGPWALPALEAASLDYGIAPMGSPFVSIKGYMMTQTAINRNHTADVIALMEYMGSAAVQKRIALTNKSVPANSVALADPEVAGLYSVAQFGEAMHLGTPMGNHPYVSCQWGPVGQVTLMIWNGSIPPANAMTMVQAAIESCVEGMLPKQ